jgi:hypothetical protein
VNGTALRSARLSDEQTMPSFVFLDGVGGANLRARGVVAVPADISRSFPEQSVGTPFVPPTPAQLLPSLDTAGGHSLLRNFVPTERAACQMVSAAVARSVAGEGADCASSALEKFTLTVSRIDYLHGHIDAPKPPFLCRNYLFRVTTE